MEVKVKRAGMFTTVQDLGRTGFRSMGVPLSGAMDSLALRLVNLLVGNPENDAVLEYTLIGPELIFQHDTLIAVGGAHFGEIPLWQPVVIPAGAKVKLTKPSCLCRGYLAVAGGFAIEPVLGSRSTYVRGKLGGFEGRTLRDEDVLSISDCARRVVGQWHIDKRILPAYSASPDVRIVPGAQAGEFEDGLPGAEFKVAPQSDRMGVRLAGRKLVRNKATELQPAAVIPGTIQVPPDGQPIVLMADAQTIGGYPQVAHVATVDLPLVAQLRPGDMVRFREITLAEAHELLLTRERAMATLREGLAGKFS